MIFKRSVTICFLFVVLITCSYGQGKKNRPKQNQVGEIVSSSGSSQMENDAWFCMKKKDYDCAIYLYSSLIKQKPKTQVYYLCRAQAYFRKNDSLNAISDLQKAIKMDGTETYMAYQMLGKINFVNNNFSKAIAYYHAAIAANDSCDFCFDELGLSYSVTYESELAIQNFKKAISLNNTVPNYFIDLALEYQDRFKFDSALYYYDEALSLKKDIPLILFNKGLLLYQMGNPDEGDTNILAAIHENSFLLPYLDDEIHRYMLGNHLKTADRLLELINQAYPDEAAYFAERAEVSTFMRDNEKAIEYYSIALTLDPENAEWHYSRGKLYLTVQQYGPAIEDFSKFIVKNPKNTEVLLKRGYAYLRMNEPNQAKIDWQKAVDLGDQKGNEYIETYLH